MKQSIYKRLLTLADQGEEVQKVLQKKAKLLASHLQTPKLAYRLLAQNRALPTREPAPERCFIIATGPSIKTQDLTSLEGEFCISVSNFFVHPAIDQIRPRYHVFARSHPPITPEQYAAWLREADQRLPAETRILMAAHDYALVPHQRLFTEREVFYYAGVGDFPVDFTRFIPPIQTIVHLALYLAMYLKVKKVYLLGCDHSWLWHHKVSQHFYEEKEHEMVRQGHNEWALADDLETQFLSYARNWKIYKEIRRHAAVQGMQIFNATPDSYLDLFPCVHLEDIVTHG